MVLRLSHLKSWIQKDYIKEYFDKAIIGRTIILGKDHQHTKDAIHNSNYCNNKINK